MADDIGDKLRTIDAELTRAEGAIKAREAWFKERHSHWQGEFARAAALANSLQCGPDSPVILAITTPVFSEVLEYAAAASREERAAMLDYFLASAEHVTQLYVIGLGLLNG